MKRNIRRRTRDRYGVIRGSVLMCIISAFLIAVFAVIQINNNVAAEKNVASIAASHAVSSFEAMVDENKRILRGAADMFINGAADENWILSELSGYGAFSRAEIKSEAVSSDEIAVAQDGDAIRFSCLIDNNKTLCAWIPLDAIRDVLMQALPAAFDFLLYETDTGRILINNTLFEENRYYDVLLALNDDGGLEELLNSDSGEVLVQRRNIRSDGNFVIAQKNTDISPWSISLVIPDVLLRSEAIDNYKIVSIAVAAAAVMVVCYVCFTVFMQRRILRSNRNTARALRMGDQAVNIIASEAKITTFLYSRSLDSVLEWHDGAEVLKNANSETRRSSLACLEELCNLKDGELERIYKAFAESSKGAVSEIQLRGFSENHDERAWNLSIRGIADDSDCLLCSLRDCTSRQIALDRREQERAYRAEAQKKASSIWMINASKNLWSVVYSKHSQLPRRLGMLKDKWSNYSNDLALHLKDYIHPADYDAFSDNMNIDAIGDAFRSGKTEFEQDYRVRSNSEKDFEWHRMCVHLWQDEADNSIIASLYIFNVDAKKNAELERGERRKILQQALTALGGIYHGLYYVDLENDLAYTARPLSGELANQLSMPYKSSFDEYISEIVHPEDQEALHGLLSAYMLRRNLTEGTRLQLRQFRRKVNDDIFTDAEIIVQPARFENGTVKEVVLAVRYL